MIAQPPPDRTQIWTIDPDTYRPSPRDRGRLFLQRARWRCIALAEAVRVGYRAGRAFYGGATGETRDH